MSDAELIADLRGKGFGVMEKAADRIEQLVASNEYLNSRLESVLSREAEAYAEHKEHLETLTEQRDEACRDAVEAEAYAMELERDLKTCRMAQVVMDNTVAELEAKLSTCEEIGKAFEEDAGQLRDKLAKAMTRVMDYSNDPHLVQFARAVLAEIEGEKV
jgi:chromosome segregation ATPase